MKVVRPISIPFSCCVAGEEEDYLIDARNVVKIEAREVDRNCRAQIWRL